MVTAMDEPDGFQAPFEECDAVARIRRTVQRLARIDLPIVIAGEHGTGRSTLASAVADLRAASGRTIIRVSGLDALTVSPRADAATDILLVRDIDALGTSDQRRLAQTIMDRATVVGTAKDATAFDPVLSNAISSGIVALPPLRERGADALSWFHLFLLDAARAQGVGIPTVSKEAQAAVRTHGWPGNLHEVKQRAERGVALIDGSEISRDHLGLEGDSLQPAIQPLEDALADFRRRYVRQVLEQCGGNRTQAARLLKVDPRTIFRFLESERR